MEIEKLKNKKIAIDDVATSYSDRFTSHKSSWAYLIKNQLKNIGITSKVLTKNDNIYDYDIWLILLPMEFVGSYNLFGGANNETARRIKRLLDFHGEIFILNEKMPDIGDFVDKRKRKCETEWQKLDSNLLSKKSHEIKTIITCLNSDTLIFGDSHAISVYIPGSNIIRLDGKTLFGILKEEWNIPDNVKHLVTYFGNIDIRHHLCRLQNPITEIKTLVERYFEKLVLYDTRISVVHALPIEYEGRRIPKTGWYNGTPFYGLQKQRSEICDVFNKELTKNAIANRYEIIAWPKEWYLMDPQEYANEIMESPGSVHISRKYYQYDFETNKQNYGYII